MINELTSSLNSFQLCNIFCIFFCRQSKMNFQFLFSSAYDHFKKWKWYRNGWFLLIFGYFFFEQKHKNQLRVIIVHHGIKVSSWRKIWSIVFVKAIETVVIFLITMWTVSALYLFNLKKNWKFCEILIIG